MANKKKQDEILTEQNSYESKAIITKIQATSRASIKVRESYFTVEFCEERMIPDIEGIDIEEERALLWDTVNDECDNQVDWLRKNL